MNVLLIGGSSRMMNAMIDWFRKNAHRVYLLTGQKDKSVFYRPVFERYDFSYDNDSIKDIMASIRPQRVVFLGAYDTNFDWYHKGRQESVYYTASLINILTAYSMIGDGRFLYISSQEVYGGSYADPVPETETVTPKGYKALAVAQGEEICRNYRRNTGVDTVTLRLDHVYSIPQKGYEQTDPCFLMCMEAIRTGRISASERKFFSMLYVKDAVELACKAIAAEEAVQECYHISSMEKISEMQLAKMIVRELGQGMEWIDGTAEEGCCLILDGERYQKEYGQELFVSYEEGVKKAVRYIKRYSSFFAETPAAGDGIGGRIRAIFGSLLPFMENLICFVPFFLLYNKTAESRYFERLDFLLLYVLLFAVVHGQQQAIVSAILSVAGYFFHQACGRSGFEILLDYNTYVWAAQLFAVGMIVGYMRDRLCHMTDEKNEELLYLQERVESISDINDSNVRMKQNFEDQLIKQKDSLGRIYEITSDLEQYDPEEVLFHAVDVLKKLINSEDVAVYIATDKSYARLFCASSENARRMGNSVKYTDTGKMYDALSKGQVFINRDMADDVPLMASAVYDKKEIRLILMVWGIPWQRMTLSEANRLTVIGAMILNAVMRSGRYLETLRDCRYIEGTDILEQETFSLLLRIYAEAREKEVMKYVLLEISVPDQNYRRASMVLAGSIRALDHMGILEDGKLYVLLTNMEEKDVTGIAERFRKAGYRSRPGKER